ncbi:MAG: hypothetical protein AAF570_02730 [Bacteroidota bacterium]
MKASTLFEILISMSLVSVVFVFGLAIFMQLNGTQAPYRRADQRLKVREMIREMEKSGEVGDKIIREKGTEYRFQTRVLNPGQELYEVIVSVYAHGEELLFRRGKIIKVEGAP